MGVVLCLICSGDDHDDDDELILKLSVSPSFYPPSEMTHFLNVQIHSGNKSLIYHRHSTNL